MGIGRVGATAAVVAAAAAGTWVAARIPAEVLLAAGPKAFWWASRSAGWVAYGLLWLATCLGLVTSGRLLRGTGAAVVAELHRFAAGLALGLVAVHGAVQLGDRYVRPGLAQLVLPFGFPYRPAWVGLGQVAAYAAAVVYASFYVRRQTGYRFWRNLHYAGLGTYAVATLHLLGAGTDVGPTAGAVVLAAASALCALLWLRLWQNPNQATGREVT